MSISYLKEAGHFSLCFDANDPLRVARFWAGALGSDIDDDDPGLIGLVPTDGTSFRIEFALVAEPKTSQNRIHLDLTTKSLDDHWVVMADPDGNEFCVLTPRNLPGQAAGRVPIVA
jgi:Glyoxalase-like domain